MTSGYFLINKPSGPTSHDIIDQLRRITGTRKIGHAGTLDPFASGLLIVGVGRESTRQLDKFLKLDKEYIAVLQLGATSDTYDREGKITQLSSRAKNSDSPEGGVERSLANASNDPDKQGDSSTALGMTKEKIEDVLNKFRGEIEQIPPMYSAKKVKGKKLYELARKGIELERQPVAISVHKLEIESFDAPQGLLALECRVSSGTYIRSLAHDIGHSLGIGSYLQELQRVSIGGYRLEAAISVDSINPDKWQEYLRDLL